MAKNTTKTSSQPVTNATPDIQAKVKADVEQTKAEMAELLDGTKAAFKAATDRDIKLSDKVLASVLANAGKAWEDMDDEAKVAFLEKAEETAAQVGVADIGISKLVSKLDPEATKVIDTCLEAKVTDKASAVMLYAQFRRVFTQSELNSMPMPGWDENDAKGSSYKPDKRKIRASTGEPVTVVWTNDFVSSMAEGKVFEKALDDAKKENDNPGTTRFQALNKDELKAVIASATQGRNNLRSLIKRTIKLGHQWEAIRKLNQIGIRWISGTKTKGVAMPLKCGQGLGEHEFVTLSPKPIWLFNQADPSKGRDFSVTQVLAFNPTNARNGENGGNMADLIATAGKGPDEEEKADGLKAGEAMADDEAQATASMFINFITKTENRAAVMKKIADFKKDTDGIEWMGIMMEIDRFVHPIAEKNRNTYMQVQQSKMLNEDAKAEDAVDNAERDAA